MKQISIEFLNRQREVEQVCTEIEQLVLVRN